MKQLREPNAMKDISKTASREELERHQPRTRSSRRPPGLLALGIINTLLLAGCSVGPDFKAPAAPKVAAYTPEQLTTTSRTPHVAGGAAQHFLNGGDIPGEWWKLFHSQPLDDLIELSLSNNPTIASAQAALKAARENVLAQRGSYFPGISGGFSASRSKTSTQISPTPSNNSLYYSLFTPQVSVSYVADVFGLNRRTMESLKAQAEATRFNLIATHITLSANVAAAAIQEASLRSQIEATRRLLVISSNMLQTLQAQFSNGYIGRLDVASQEAQLAQMAATLPPLLKQLAQQRHLLAVLAGSFPSQNPAAKFDFGSLKLPDELPVSLPSKLVEQRPDIRQAEATLHAASAQIGVAVANRLPNITLSGDAGAMAVEAGKIFAGGSGFWDLAGGITQPIFEGGTLLHQERAARAAYIQAAADYRSTVLTAFQNVADTLTALKADADALKAAAAAQDAAKAALDLGEKQYHAGYAGYLSLLGAEQTYQQAVISLAQARADRYADTAALFQALGGGWWHRADLTRN
jgi:NodT family efflux transporter outer membrane factor (OMF) lipoprotein